jgi:hypothetical protein
MDTWANEGALVIVPLQDPWPFGAGEVLKAHADGRLDIQWLGNSTSSLRKPPKGVNAYDADAARVATHLPYCVSNDANGIAFHQHDVIMHSFELTKEGHQLLAVILRALAAHPDVWWDGNDEPLLRE